MVLDTSVIDAVLALCADDHQVVLLQLSKIDPTPPATRHLQKEELEKEEACVRLPELQPELKTGMSFEAWLCRCL